jgi:YD repeat-containing protein
VAPLPIEVEGGVFSPSFSADGAGLFFHHGRDRGRLLHASLLPGNGSLSAQPVTTEGNNFHARPSPDGQWIAFDSDRDGVRGVYVMRHDGGELRRVSGDGFAAIPSWSPDMKWLAFVRAEPARPQVWNLWLRDMASGDLRRVSDYRSGQVWSASWFPDGSTLCYSHDDSLIIADVATGHRRVFNTPVAGRLTRTPAVSPDGHRIVFQVHRDGVWMLDVATGAMRRILDDGTAEEFAWDPDGRRIAYHSRRSGGWRIWMMTI